MKNYPFVILMLVSRIAMAADFEIPHRFQDGDLVSADQMNEVFDKIQGSQRSSAEEDLLGTWSCSAYADPIVADDEAVVSQWKTGNDIIPVSLTNVSITFSKDSSSGNYALATSAPNPFDVTDSSALAASYQIQGDMFFFKETSSSSPPRETKTGSGFTLIVGKTNYIYVLNKVSDTRIRFEGVASDDGDATVICDAENLPPNNPMDFAVEMQGSNVTLSWKDNSSDEDGFKILRRDDLTGTFHEIVIITGPGSTQYSETLVGAGTYWYRVQAFNENGDSLGSNVVKVTIE